MTTTTAITTIMVVIFLSQMLELRLLEKGLVTDHGQQLSNQKTVPGRLRVKMSAVAHLVGRRPLDVTAVLLQGKVTMHVHGQARRRACVQWQRQEAEYLTLETALIG